MGHVHDAIVVGAGFAGLSAAVDLVERGYDVGVLEARPRVGGRVESMVLEDGMRIDSGGQFLCADMPNVMALARHYGKTLVRPHMEGNFILQPPADEAESWRIYRESANLRERIKGLDPGDPSLAGLSVADWLAGQNASDDGARAFRSMIEGLWCRPIGEVPLWYLVSNDRRITNTRSELEYFLGETMHSLAGDLARDLGPRLCTATPVDRILTTNDAVEIRAGGGTFRARQVIVAVPPVMASRIVFEPGLPHALASALNAWKSGTVIKALLRYPRRFWRDDGLSGMVMWRDPAGLFACDVSRDGRGAALVVFAGGQLAVEWRQMARGVLQDAIVGKLAAALGPDARDATEISLRDWTDDPWSGGGYSDTIADASATSAEEIIRAGRAPIHFACSELSSSFPGYVEGAIVAGREAAHRVEANARARHARA
ncbi:flavin monoamine oxidase family protein [Rhizobiaceae bacterium n13]|uniref:Flavin monoamine oxidase family protein n=1 Tax=Ferirhizobium litorale TaxID=2927786 RepID=A0AAE3QCC0_9HYPH|nr:flavin monoamine oxidase family protein [Fererhizobium litorale]MDI7863155.1 flavin monoamine oxidase family protein [Fererhizobium litorale]MDI7923167.1 flavin monoamine oxidase family protein [Fererhizobium litorale]